MNVCSYFKMLPWLQDEYYYINIQNVAMATLINNHYYMNMYSYVPLFVYCVLSKMLPWLQKLKM